MQGRFQARRVLWQRVHDPSALLGTCGAGMRAVHLAVEEAAAAVDLARVALQRLAALEGPAEQPLGECEFFNLAADDESNDLLLHSEESDQYSDARLVDALVVPAEADETDVAKASPVVVEASSATTFQDMSESQKTSPSISEVW